MTSYLDQVQTGISRLWKHQNLILWATRQALNTFMWLCCSMQLPNSMRRTESNRKASPPQHRYKDRYVDADGCSNFCAVGLFLKHQTDRKWPHLRTSTRETHEHDCTWWLRHKKHLKKKAHSHTNSHSRSNRTHSDAQTCTDVAQRTWESHGMQRWNAMQLN